MAPSDESVLGELSCNFGDLNVRAKNGKGISSNSGGKQRLYDEDVLPHSGRVRSIDVTKDFETGMVGGENVKQTNHSKQRQASSSGTGTGSRGDRFIPNRELSRSAGLMADHLRDGMGGETLAGRSNSSNNNTGRASSPFDRTINDHSQNLTGSSKGLDFDDMDDSNAPADLGEALQMERGHRILSFNAMAPDTHSAPEMRSRYAVPRPKILPSSLTAGGRRRIATTPEKTLDTPDMRDDFYSHLLCWSSQNVIAIALGGSVHTWNGNTGDVSEVCDLLEMSERVGGGQASVVKAMTWDDSGTLLQIGTNTGHVQIWDMETQTRVRTFKPSADGQDAADNTSVTTTSWAEDGTLALGYWSGLLREHDLRQRDSIIRDIHNAHTQSVCGMSYRADSALLATGGNDNVVKVWDRRSNTAKMQKERHRAAVRALSWSPMNSSLLATGGGTLDKSIHFWNVTQGTRLQSIQTDAQVTALHWSYRYKEIASCHGTSAASEGSATPSYLNLWSYPSLDKLESLAAHESRTLHSCLSPDGQVLATCGTDESLKFWRLFEVLDDAKSKSSTGTGGVTSTGSSSAGTVHVKAGANGGVKKMHSLR
ncbi:hypothetical protein L7F22_068148 [Adiantum nelumboides]|nr:hypothetical protein [Adiantum nelumboides]